MPAEQNDECYTFIGKGKQGRVFQLSNNCCIKVYGESRYAERETKAYMMAKSSSFIPKFYESGPNYIIVEYIQGKSLKKYIKTQGEVSAALASQILSLIKEMKRLRFTRIDAALRHIIITDNNEIKVIDLTNSYTHKSQTPRMLLDGLKRLGQKDVFLEHVKKLEPSLFFDWTKSH